MKSYKAIINLIKESGINQTELARRAGLTPTAVNRWMNHRVTEIRPSNVESVAYVLGKEVFWIDHNRTECEFRDSGFVKGPGSSSKLVQRLFELERRFENIEESGREYATRIDWHVGFAGWLQMEYEIDYEQKDLYYPILQAHDGKGYTWKEVLGYRKEKLIGVDYLGLLHTVERDAVVGRSREVSELAEKMYSPIIETDRIFRFQHSRGHYEQLFLHSRINLVKKIAKCWYVPLPQVYF